jgi:hypothetical protein
MVTKPTDKKTKESIRQRNEFTGSHEGAIVVNWMNNPRRPPNDEIEQLLGKEEKYQSSVGEQRTGAFKELNDYFEKVVDRWEVGNRPQISYDLLNGRTFRTIPKTIIKIDRDQYLALWKAWELMQIDLLTRVRRCRRERCGKWFFAVFDHAQYHSAECRNLATSSSPKFREHRKKYMRQRRKKQAGRGK